MAIGFIRVEYVKRANGKNACAKAAYNNRTRIHFDGHKFTQEQTYDWSEKEKPAFHEIFLPSNINEKFKNPELLWNAVEAFEKRKDSQVAIDLVLALPDDKQITPQDRYELAKTFIEKHFVAKGYGVQLDIHQPEQHDRYSEETGELQENEHNWHAHLLVTPRLFDKSGESFNPLKPRELMPSVRKGFVVSGTNWVKEWSQHQNEFFEDRGLDIRVDPTGVVSQLHLGPHRMRHRLADVLLEKQESLIEINRHSSKNPSLILKKLTENQSTFSKEDFERFISKYIDPSLAEEIKLSFWNCPEIVQLHDKNSKMPLAIFTSKEVVEEEERILRLAKRIHERRGPTLSIEKMISPSNLTGEQARAFQNTIAGKALTFIEGHAGTGKSVLLFSLKKVYEDGGYIVRAFGPDTATVKVLEEKGFKDVKNIHQFLFKNYYQSLGIRRNNEVWLVDEAGKIGSEAFVEFLKVAEERHAKVVFSGSALQMSSVGRGGIFRELCHTFGCEYLVDVQRQKTDYQREISKKLALGQISAAFDAIASKGGFYWSDTKENSIIKAIEKWASDKIYYPYTHSMIVAHSNAEVRHINDLARLCRKGLGELGEKEFQCQTIYGKTEVSEGDLIEFRRNEKTLGVINGMSGVLISAKEDEFVVLVKEKDKKIVFNPKTYSSFQLGYATTYYRSQGRTFDRTYLLHNPRMTKEGFYVGLTRHVRSVHCFVSKTQAKCLSELKLQALKNNLKYSTLAYTTSEKLRGEEKNKQYLEKIDHLKASDSFLDKTKGLGLTAWNAIHSKIGETVSRLQDRSLDREFYDIKTPEQPIAKVIEVDSMSQPLSIQHIRHIVDSKHLPSAEKQIHSSKDQFVYPKITDKQNNLLKNYVEKSNSASELYEIVKAETEGTGKLEKTATHYSLWQQSCMDRNKAAYDLVQGIVPKSLKNLMKNRSYDILIDRSQRYEVATKPKVDLEESLRQNIESLLYKLFPDGPTRRDSKGFRFGSKCSLSVTCSGPKQGTFYDFERGEGGGMITLIKFCQGLGTREAKDWAMKFLGESSTITAPKQFSIKNMRAREEDGWISLLPTKEAPSLLKDISKHLDQNYNLIAKHPYRDQKGNLLFYNLRLSEKKNPSHKIVIPLSFGYWKSGDQDPHWQLKKYHSGNGKNPIYNIDLVTQNPSKPILIVEGEKTAEAGSRIFGDQFVTISWFGGSGGASKVDWIQLHGREIVIWPDNDKSGYKAAEEICICLRRVGVKELKMVDPEILSKHFPEKWDIADSLPEGKSIGFLSDSLLRAPRKAVGLDKILNTLHLNQSDTEIFGQNYQRNRLNEILWRVEERLYIDNRQKSNPQEFENQVLTDVSSIIRSEKELLGIIKTNEINQDLCKKTAVQGLIDYASTGQKPSPERLSEILSIVKLCGTVNERVAGVERLKPEHQIAFDCICAAVIMKKMDEVEKINHHFKNEYSSILADVTSMDRGSLLQREKTLTKEIEQSL